MIQKLYEHPNIRIEKSGLASLSLAANMALSDKKKVLIVLPENDIDTFIHYNALFSEKHKEQWLYFPHSTYIKKSPTIFYAQYMSALYQLSYSSHNAVLCSPFHLCLKAPSKELFEHNSLTITPQDTIGKELLIEQLFEWGYRTVPMVNTMGELASRGDILDIYPPHIFSKDKQGHFQEYPIRIEFFGDSIESIRTFLPTTQRSLENKEEITFFPIHPLIQNYSSQKKRYSYWDKLHTQDTINDDTFYVFRKYLDGRFTTLAGAGFFEDTTIALTKYFPNTSILFTRTKEDIKEGLVSACELWENFLKKEEDVHNTLLPPSLLFEENAHILTQLEHYNSIIFERVPTESTIPTYTFPERSYSSFKDILLASKKQEFEERPWQTLLSTLLEWRQEYTQVIIAFTSIQNRNKFLSLTHEDFIHFHTEYTPSKKGIFALLAPLSGGTDILWASIRLLGEDALLIKKNNTEYTQRNFQGLDEYKTLQEGDYIVHKEHGIGKYSGLHRLTVAHIENEYLLLLYTNNDKLYVPVDQLSYIQRFKGDSGTIPSLDTLGSTKWKTATNKARKAIETIAHDLVEMYAWRTVEKKYRYGPLSSLYKDFEASFGFEETPDQLKAINDVLDDMEKAAPMDRLICGDVGFGKTEIALRAAVRAALDGRQIAFLCPTTILAEQHYQSIRSRLANLPINVALLNRFVSKTQQKQIISSLEKGSIDIIIGTHRLLSADIVIPNLSLLILDEEQRFGVRHKEKLKVWKKDIDSLTLTATPIPRTLQLSIAGIRELSLIETAPLERKAIISSLCELTNPHVQATVEKELARNGQIFWVCNRIHKLEERATYLQTLFPLAKIGIAHGQLPEHSLEKIMHDFWRGDIDILLATSIIESGLDFPNANTLIVENAHMFGLGQLYQLRGRVGRSNKQAYAFFLIPPYHQLSEIAQERLEVILNMDFLGAGFQVAMEDLRIRGAGNILGEAQSGQIMKIGLDMYLEILEEEVKKIKNTSSKYKKEYTTNVELSLSLPVFIPEEYITDSKERLTYYRMLSTAKTSQDIYSILQEIQDRFGTIPKQLSLFSSILETKLLLTRLGICKADISKSSIKITWSDGQDLFSPEDIINWVQRHATLRISPPASIEYTFTKETISQNFSHFESLMLELLG
ncbi:MAG: transcription-repair coupling factor [Desulfovibrionaceae bacterium]